MRISDIADGRGSLRNPDTNGRRAIALTHFTLALGERSPVCVAQILSRGSASRVAPSGRAFVPRPHKPATSEVPQSPFDRIEAPKGVFDLLAPADAESEP